MQFLRRYVVWIVVVLVLFAVVYFAVDVYATNRRERRIAEEIESIPGLVEGVRFRFCGPSWIPSSVQGKLPLWRIQFVTLAVSRIDRLPGERPKPISAKLLERIGTLSQIQRLNLGDRDVTDENVRHLENLKSLSSLYLYRTSLSDHGLESLKKLTSLTVLHLASTDTTPAGRASLRSALPNCKIEPDP